MKDLPVLNRVNQNVRVSNLVAGSLEKTVLLKDQLLEFVVVDHLENCRVLRWIS